MEARIDIWNFVINIYSFWFYFYVFSYMQRIWLNAYYFGLFQCCCLVREAECHSLCVWNLCKNSKVGTVCLLLTLFSNHERLPHKSYHEMWHFFCYDYMHDYGNLQSIFVLGISWSQKARWKEKDVLFRMLIICMITFKNIRASSFPLSGIHMEH